MANIFSIIVGFCMITASIITYGIQYYKIIKKESIKGINLYMIFMGVISNYLTSLSYLHANLHDMKNDFAITLDIVQLFILDFIYILYFTIYLYYTYKNCIILQNLQNVNLLTSTEYIKYKITLLLYISSWFFIIVFAVVSIFISLHDNSKMNNNYIISTNILSSTLSSVMWIPQLVESYRYTYVKTSLSSTFMFLNILGILVIIIYQYIINKQNILLIIQYFITVILQICILLVLYFKKRHNLNHILLDIEHHDIL